MTEEEEKSTSQQEVVVDYHYMRKTTKIRQEQFEERFELLRCIQPGKGQEHHEVWEARHRISG